MEKARGFRRKSGLVALTLAALVTGLFPAAPAHATAEAEVEAIKLPVHKVPALSRPGLANRLKGLPKQMPATKGAAAPKAGAASIMPMRAGLNAKAPAVTYPQMDRVSLASDGTELDNSSHTGLRQAISGDGRYVVFTTLGRAWIFPYEITSQVVLRDRQTGAMELISSADGFPGSGDSDEASLSADGRYVVFASAADDLVPGDTNGATDVFVFDRTTRKMERVSIAASGEEADGDSYRASISDDGRYVAFTSQATNLANVYAEYNAFVYDRTTHKTELISRSAAGVPFGGNSYNAVISGNGQYVAFDSLHGELPSYGGPGIFRFDRTKQTVDLVSLTNAGVPADDRSYMPSISSDGSKVAFLSYAPNLIGNLSDVDPHVYVRDLSAKKTIQADTTPAGEPGHSYADTPAISRDGSTVAFASTAWNLMPGMEAAYTRTIYVKTLKTGAIRLASTNRFGLAAELDSSAPSLTADGRYVAFTSEDGNLVPNDFNEMGDVFVSGPDVTAPTFGQTLAGTPAVYLYAYHEAYDEFELAGIGVASGKNVVLPVGPGFQADGWAIEVYLSEITSAATLSKKGVDLADDGFSFAMEIGAPTTKGTSYTLDLTDLVGNKGSQTIQVQSYTKGPTITLTSPTENPVTVGASGRLTISGKSDQPLLEVCLLDLSYYELFDCTSNNAGNTFTFTTTVPEDGDYAVYGWNGALFYAEGESWMLAGLSSPRTIGFDDTAPGTPLITSPAFVDGVLYAKAKDVTISGTTEPFATLTADLGPGDRVVTAQADKAGKFSLPLKSVPVGASLLTLTTADRFGNTDEPVELPLVVDLTAPVLEGAYFVGGNAETYARPDGAGKYTVSIPGKDEGVIALSFSETVATVKVNKAVAEAYDSYFEYPVIPSAATNTYAIEAKDLAGNVTTFTVTIKVDATAPKLTVSTPSATAYLGVSGGGDAGLIIAGTANETLVELAVYEDFGPAMEPMRIDANISMDGTKWSAGFFVPGEASTHKYFVLGQDMAGNWSVRDPKGADIRTVTVDPDAPELIFDENSAYQGDDTIQFLTAPASVLVKGALSDQQSGPAKVQVGTTTVTSKDAKATGLAFSQTVSLKEGYNDVTIVGTDRAGNTSQAYRLRALIKTKINTPTVKASFSTGKQYLVVSGTTDRAYVADAEFIGVIPVTIVVTKKSGEEVDRVTFDAPGDSVQYDPGKGTFKYTVDMSGWSSGKYSVTVTAGAPLEFQDLKPKTSTVTVTRP